MRILSLLVVIQNGWLLRNFINLLFKFLNHYQVLVQLGDILDRGEDEIAILSLLKSLDVQAKTYGGAVFQVR